MDNRLILAGVDCRSSCVGGVAPEPKRPCRNDWEAWNNRNEGNADAKRAAIMDIEQSKVSGRLDFWDATMIPPKKKSRDGLGTAQKMYPLFNLT